MRNTLYPKARTKDLVVMPLADEMLVYDLSNNEAHCLNESAAFVWSKCNGDIWVDEITKAVEARFATPVDADFVRLALSQLNERKLLTASGFDLPKMPNRREAIRRIGLASAVAVPIIASIVAPSSVLANASCSCVSDFMCPMQAGKACLPNAFKCNPNGVCSQF
ncbi:hypothetical protein BH10ACI2_BH10ACI2_18350 [soil metagenome]